MKTPQLEWLEFCRHIVDRINTIDKRTPVASVASTEMPGWWEEMDGIRDDVWQIIRKYTAAKLTDEERKALGL